MRKSDLLALIPMILMLIATFVPIASAIGPPQPPVDTTALHIGTIGWGPVDASPHKSYDTGSGELLFNCYDTLITMGAPVTNLWGEWEVHEQYWEFEPSLATNVPDPQEVVMVIPDTGINVSDPSCYWFEPISVEPPEFAVNPFYHINGWIDNNPDDVLGPCDVIYIGEFTENGNFESIVTKRTWYILEFEPGVSMTVHHCYYDFIIRTEPVINYIESYTGAIVDTFDIYDAEYSIKKGLVMDHYGGPMWMFYKPLFDTMGSDDWEGAPADAYDLSYLIEDAIEIVDTNTLRINLGIAFPDVAWKQILSQGWASIQSKEYSLSIGCWDGDLFSDVDPANGIPDWFEYWRHMEYGPYEAEWLAGPQVKRYASTGPYYVGVLSEANNLVVLLSHDIDHCGDDYWKGWPSTANSLVGARMQDYLKEIHIEYIELWATRRASFEACEIDVCSVPRAFMEDLLDDFGEPTNPNIKTIKKISPILSMAAIFYNFDIASTSTGIYTGEFPDGIPEAFFNNTYIRKAFSYAFNRSRYLAEAYLGEAIVRETPNIYGLEPDYYTYDPDPPWTYDVDYEKAKQALKDAMFDTDGDGVPDTSVWDAGFKMDLLYNTGNDQRRIACYYLRDFFALLSGDPERAGKPPFTLVVKNVDWPTYITALIHYELTIFVLGWLADFADADNWVRPYMHTYGDFSYFTGYNIYIGWDEPGPRTGLNKDQLIDLAVKTPDGPERAEMYADLDDIYIRDCPSLPIAQATGRRWQKCWVRGWYYNALYPSSYYYHMYKKDACWADVTGPSIGTPDGVTNMRDIGYIAGHFLESQPPPYDDSWAPGSYGCAGADVYGDRRIDMRDIGYACLHFGHTECP